MNIIVAIIISLKRSLECIKMHHFGGKHAKIFLGRGYSPSPRLQRLHSSADPPDHISGYGPGSSIATMSGKGAESPLKVPLISHIRCVLTALASTYQYIIYSLHLYSPKIVAITT